MEFNQRLKRMILRYYSIWQTGRFGIGALISLLIQLNDVNPIDCKSLNLSYSIAPIVVQWQGYSHKLFGLAGRESLYYRLP